MNASSSIHPDQAGSSRLTLPLLLLLAWLTYAVPLFLRMPLTNDAVLFDLQAGLIALGSVIYKDILEPNLPGVIWIHQLVRAVGGHSSEALRGFDLLVFAALMTMTATWLHRTARSWRAALWTVLTGCFFYLSTSEWCHCQRDLWMVTVVVAGAILRLRQVERLTSDTSRGLVLGWSLLEGLLWGAGVWIKPYTLLMAAAVWLITLRRGQRHGLIDFAGLFAGGSLMGLAGIGWLMAQGAWPAFVDTLQTWNPLYYKAGRENWTLDRFKPMVIRFAPWILLHLVAVPVAVRTLAARIRDAGPTDLRAAALSAVYLVWIGQAFFLQHLFDYVHAPGILLAILLLSDWLARQTNPRLMLVPLMVFAVLVAIFNPAVHQPRGTLWLRCIRERSTPELQDRLSHFANPRRERLEAVARFLETQNVRDGDVLCFNSDTVSLYVRLGLRPPTRYVYLYEILAYFPQMREQISRELETAPHRFVVADLVSMGMDRRKAEESGPDGPLAPPPSLPRYRDKRYPASHPVVFRDHEYLVHRVTQPLGRVQSPR